MARWRASRGGGGLVAVGGCHWQRESGWTAGWSRWWQVSHGDGRLVTVGGLDERRPRERERERDEEDEVMHKIWMEMLKRRIWDLMVECDSDKIGLGCQIEF